MSMQKVKYLSKKNPILLIMFANISSLGTMVKKKDRQVALLLTFCIFLIFSFILFSNEALDVYDDGRSIDNDDSSPPHFARGTRSPGPDLTMDPPLVIIGENENITFSNEEPNEGDTISINSTVTNIGDESANATVAFYDGHPDDNDLIGSDTVFVEPGLSISVSTQWDTTGEAEDHMIYVVVDPEDSVNETDEYNNLVLRDIIVNQRPTADAGDDILAFVGRPVIFDGGGSWDTQMESLNYSWDLGDGTQSIEKIVEHTYQESGVYSVTLTVTDTNLAFDLDLISIEVRHLPIQIDIVEILELSECRPGQELEITGSVEFEFSPSLLNIEKPPLILEIEILETGDTWVARSDENGNYNTQITAPNETGFYTVEVSLTYGPIQRSTSKDLRVSHAQTTSYFTVEFGLLFVALATAAIVGMIYGGSELGRYRLLLLIFIPLYTRIKKDKVLDHFHRGRLYNYIEMHPGVTFTELKKKFAFKNGNLVYHLNFLEKMDFLRSKKEGRHRRFYIKGDFSKSEDISLFVNEIQKKIVSVIQRSPGITQSKIAAILGTSRQKISYNINALEYAGLIRSIREDSRKIKYYPVLGESG
jgi:predicted transcriptional regulator